MTWMYNTPHYEDDLSVWKDWMNGMIDAVKDGTALPYYEQAIEEAKEHIAWVENRLAEGKAWGNEHQKPTIYSALNPLSESEIKSLAQFMKTTVAKINERHPSKKTLTNKDKQVIIEKPVALTKSEIESLRQKMKKAGEIAKAYFSK